jgi:hypothetical protein
MGYMSSNLARKVGRSVGWREKIWSRRYQAIVISSEAPAQVERLRYVLAHGVKEGLVEKVSQWPGLHCTHSLLTGEAVEGYWFDGTQEYAARRRGEEIDPMRFATRETLVLSPLPCWKHLPEEQRRKLVADLIAEIELEAAAHRQRTGSEVLGASAVQGQHPSTVPGRPRDRPRRCSMRRARRSAWSFTPCTGGSSLPSERQPKSSEPGTGRPGSPPGAFHRLCRS